MDSISSTSGYYSTAAGVMAGFAFVALFPLILEKRGLIEDEALSVPHSAPGSDTHDAGPTRSMGAAATEALSVGFTALLLSAITYAVLAGEIVSGGRAASAEIVAGAAFAVSALQLFYAIALLVCVGSLKVPQLQDFFSHLGAGLCPITYLLLIVGLDDYHDVREGNGGSHHVLASAFVLLLLLSGALGIAYWRKCKKRPVAAVVNPSYCALGAALIGVVGSTWTESRTVDQTLSPPVIMAVMLAACVILINQGLGFLAPETPYRFSRKKTKSPQIS